MLPPLTGKPACKPALSSPRKPKKKQVFSIGDEDGEGFGYNYHRYNANLPAYYYPGLSAGSYGGAVGGCVAGRKQSVMSMLVKRSWF